MSANLECFLIFKNSITQSTGLLTDLLKLLQNKSNVEISVVEDEQHFAPKAIQRLDEINYNNTNEISFSRDYNFFDTVEKCVVSFYIEENIIGVSIPELVIWGNDHKAEPKIERLEKFYAICREIARIKKPDFMVIGTESHMAEDLMYSEVSKSDEFKPFQFSDLDNEKVTELFNWYTTEYYNG